MITINCALVALRTTAEGVPEVTKTISISLSDSINLGLLLLTAIGLVFAGTQLMQTKKINRANLVRELAFTLYNDSELREAFYKVEWSEFKGGEIKLEQGTREERIFDKLLTFFDIICNMYYRGILTKEDIKVFSYEMLRVYEHPDIQEYLDFLKEWQTLKHMSISYTSYKKYCKCLANKI